MNTNTNNNVAVSHVEYAFSREDCYGFTGTLRSNYDLGWRANSRLWLVACEAVEKSFGVTDRKVVRNFLRSHHGRHLADDLSRRMPRSPDEADVRKAIELTNWQKEWARRFCEIEIATNNGTWEE